MSFRWFGDFCWSDTNWLHGLYQVINDKLDWNFAFFAFCRCDDSKLEHLWSSIRAASYQQNSKRVANDTISKDDRVRHAGEWLNQIAKVNLSSSLLTMLDERGGEKQKGFWLRNRQSTGVKLSLACLFAIRCPEKLSFNGHLTSSPLIKKSAAFQNAIKACSWHDVNNMKSLFRNGAARTARSGIYWEQPVGWLAITADSIRGTRHRSARDAPTVDRGSKSHVRFH